MGVTAIKRIENRSGATVALRNLENANAPGHGVPIAPGQSLQVDIWIPWAPNWWDFAGKHLEIQFDGRSRYWLWQAANADGDFVRVPTDGRWRDQGQRVPGLSEVNGDRTVVVADGYISFLRHSAPLGPNITAIKRVENRSDATAALFNAENPRTLGHGQVLAPGETRAVDMWIPWAANAEDFPRHHLRLDLGGQPRYWIWQASKGDGDQVRFSTTNAWHDPGERVPGEPAVRGDRTLTVFSHSFSLLPHAAPVPMPWITAIKRVDNRSGAPVALFDVENPTVPGHGVTIAPGESRPVDMWIPWAAQAQDFPRHHLQLHVGGRPRFWLWQASQGDGDFVRFASDGAWHDRGEPVHGVSGVNGDRTLVVVGDCFELVTQSPMGIPIADVQGLIGTGGHRLCPEQPRDPHAAGLPSEPKRSAVAFSVAGFASDALRRGEPGARFRYHDSGKRYAFGIDEHGLVWATPPAGPAIPLREAVSYSRRRVGESSAAPPFDLIAASGGRVFAKERGQDRFYFAALDETFVHATPDGDEDRVPSTYFKLDPEFNQPGARSWDLTAHVAGCHGHHPAAERFPQLFWPMLDRSIADTMIVRVEPGRWHLVDPRPPLSRFHPQVLIVEALKRMRPSVPLPPFIQDALNLPADLLKAALERLLTDPTTEMAPPAWVPTYEHVRHCKTDLLGTRTIPLYSIDYKRVLDIGVGHVHWHEQYQGVTGGELQPLRTGRLLPDPLPPVTYADLYRLANGPVRDGDGFVDGTCNFYALVQLKETALLDADRDGRIDQNRQDAFALLYLDEQSYFTQRWRLVHPDDVKGLLLALAKGLNDQPGLYGWRKETYWCPCRAGHVGLKSRVAVAAQVLLVTGGDPPDREAGILYSINFSYSTMDRTWRWRELPAPARYFATAADQWHETIPNQKAATVYPQTVRLREDMTIHVKGTGPTTSGAGVGRWYQRYLPAGNHHLPPADALLPGQRPPTPFAHPWKFVLEPVFERADRFSHVGVYDAVDSRTQFYPVEPASEADAQALAAGQAGAWVDDGGQLAVGAWHFPWHGGMLRQEARRPPSLFEPVTRLRIVRRGPRGWIAMHWDKRDDDLLPFDDLPKVVVLTNGGGSVRVTLGPNVWVEQPPAVERASFDWGGGETQATVAISVPQAPGVPPLENVWRVRMAALKDPSGEVVPLLDLTTDNRFTLVAGRYVARWKPTVAEQASWRAYCSAAGVRHYGTSLWCEDILGHVAVPDQVTITAARSRAAT